MLSNIRNHPFDTECRMTMSAVKITLLLALLAPMVAFSQEEAPAVASTSSNAPTDQQLAAIRCPISEERFLPGDYYYCLGALNYGEHDYRNSLRFFTTAATWASKPAAYVLGTMALHGDNQPVNRPLALAWWALATERPQSRFQNDYDSLYKATTRQEHRRTEALLLKMRPLYGDEVAAKRAEARYVAGMQWLKWQNTPGRSICLAGMTDPTQNPPGSSMCPPVQQVVENIDKLASTVFEGWTGHVQVGALEQVPASASTSAR
jgi:hypothetical protein